MNFFANFSKILAFTSVALMLAACGDDSSNDFEENLSIEDLELTGTSQKGPFVVGTTVIAYELENGKTLKQTGRSFAGTIKTNDGLYKIPSVSLVSQYAYLVANGSYRNEVTGKNSDKTITMRAITDLSSRKTANINLITHLEYDRVVYLVTREGMSVLEAKKQAEEEIFKAFHFDFEKFALAEDLNVLGNSDADGALLAISILLQNDNDSDQLNKELSAFSKDIESDGTWDDKDARKKMAEWAFLKDSTDEITSWGLMEIREHVASWNLGTVPDFEKYIYDFWNEENKIGVCNENNKGERKGPQEKFLCNGKRWVKTPAIEEVDDAWHAAWLGILRGEMDCDFPSSKTYGMEGRVFKCIDGIWKEVCEEEGAPSDYNVNLVTNEKAVCVDGFFVPEGELDGSSCSKHNMMYYNPHGEPVFICQSGVLNEISEDNRCESEFFIIKLIYEDRPHYICVDGTWKEMVDYSSCTERYAFVNLPDWYESAYFCIDVEEEENLQLRWMEVSNIMWKQKCYEDGKVIRSDDGKIALKCDEGFWINGL